MFKYIVLIFLFCGLCSCLYSGALLDVNKNSSISGFVKDKSTGEVLIGANVYLKDTSTLVESPSTIIKESVGIYYVDLTPILYSYDNVYDLKWTIQYITGAPLKTLITTFKLNPVNISGEIYTEFENQIINTEVNDQIIEIIIL